jgi:hypothetical protein
VLMRNKDKNLPPEPPYAIPKNPDWWRDFLARLPLPMLALGASYGVYQFNYDLQYVPQWVAIVIASSFELTYLGLSVIKDLPSELRLRARRIAQGAVGVSIIYNVLGGLFTRNPQLLTESYNWGQHTGKIALEFVLAATHGVPLALVAFLVADLVLHTLTRKLLQPVPLSSAATTTTTATTDHLSSDEQPPATNQSSEKAKQWQEYANYLEGELARQKKAQVAERAALVAEFENRLNENARLKPVTATSGSVEPLTPNPAQDQLSPLNLVEPTSKPATPPLNPLAYREPLNPSPASPLNPTGKPAAQASLTLEPKVSSLAQLEPVIEPAENLHAHFRLEPLTVQSSLDPALNPLAHRAPAANERLNPATLLEPMPTERLNPLVQFEPVENARLNPVANREPAADDQPSSLAQSEPVTNERLNLVVQSEPLTNERLNPATDQNQPELLTAQNQPETRERLNLTSAQASPPAQTNESALSQLSEELEPLTRGLSQPQHEAETNPRYFERWTDKELAILDDVSLSKREKARRLWGNPNLYKRIDNELAQLAQARAGSAAADGRDAVGLSLEISKTHPT